MSADTSPRSFFQKHYDDLQEDDGRYRPWMIGKAGTFASFKLLPAVSTGLKRYRIPYLQPITTWISIEETELALFCPASELTVYLEGEGLGELDDLISERRIRSIHGYDYEKQPPWDDSGAYVSSINFEKSS